MRPHIAHTCEFAAVDALAACSVALGEIAALYHEALDNSVKRAAFVVQRNAAFLTLAFLPSA